MNKETEDKIMAHIEDEWEKFKQLVGNTHEKLPDGTFWAIKMGFYGGFKAGAIAMHDAEKIL
jgi:hypothetical protein